MTNDKMSPKSSWRYGIMTDPKSCFRTRLTNFISICILFWALGSFGGVIASAKSDQDSFERLKAMEQRFHNYQKDFLDFAKSGLYAGSEFDSARELVRSADETGNFLTEAGTLLSIYGALSCSEDKVRVRPIIKGQLAFYSERINFSIKETNIELVNIKRSAPLAEATRMRDDLREAQGLLDSHVRTRSQTCWWSDECYRNARSVFSNSNEESQA